MGYLFTYAAVPQLRHSIAMDDRCSVTLPPIQTGPEAEQRFYNFLFAPAKFCFQYASEKIIYF